MSGKKTAPKKPIVQSADSDNELEPTPSARKTRGRSPSDERETKMALDHPVSPKAAKASTSSTSSTPDENGKKDESDITCNKCGSWFPVEHSECPICKSDMEMTKPKSSTEKKRSALVDRDDSDDERPSTRKRKNSAEPTARRRETVDKEKDPRKEKDLDKHQKNGKAHSDSDEDDDSRKKKKRGPADETKKASLAPWEPYHFMTKDDRRLREMIKAKDEEFQELAEKKQIPKVTVDGVELQVLDPFVRSSQGLRYDFLWENLHDYGFVLWQPDLGNKEYCEKLQVKFINRTNFERGAELDTFPISFMPPFAPASGGTRNHMWPYGGWKMLNPEYILMTPEERKENTRRKKEKGYVYIDPISPGVDRLAPPGKDMYQKENIAPKGRMKAGQTNRFYADRSDIVVVRRHYQDPDTQEAKSIPIVAMDRKLMERRFEDYARFVSALSERVADAGISYSIAWAMDSEYQRDKLDAVKIENNKKRYGVPVVFSDRIYKLGLPELIDPRVRPETPGQASGARSGLSRMGVQMTNIRNFKTNDVLKKAREVQTGRSFVKKEIPRRKEVLAPSQLLHQWVQSAPEAVKKDPLEWHKWCKKEAVRPDASGKPVYSEPLTQTESTRDGEEPTTAITYTQKLAKDESNYDTHDLHDCKKHKEVERYEDLPDPTCAKCDNEWIIRTRPDLLRMWNNDKYRMNTMPMRDIWNQAEPPPGKKYEEMQIMEYTDRVLDGGDFFAPIAQIKVSCINVSSKDFLRLRFRMIDLFKAGDKEEIEFSQSTKTAFKPMAFLELTKGLTGNTTGSLKALKRTTDSLSIQGEVFETDTKSRASKAAPRALLAPKYDDDPSSSSSSREKDKKSKASDEQEVD